MKIGFTGDLSFSGYFQGKEGEDILAPEIKSFLGESQWTVINLESPVTASEETEKERLAHRCSRRTLDFVKNNFNNPVISLANNHIMDYGEQGLEDTLKALDEEKLKKIGAGPSLKEASRPVILENDGFRIGIMAVQYKKTGKAEKEKTGVMHDSFDALIRKNLKSLRKQTDAVVLVYHGGEEFLHTPMPYNRKEMRRYIDWGADAVVAHHPHTVQGYEKYKGKYIFYSLGNFIFDTDYQRVQPDSEDGMLLRLNIDEKSRDIDFQCCPIRINREKQIIEGREEDAFFKDINSLDYESLWTGEAVRKKEILARSNAVEPSSEKKKGKAARVLGKLGEALKSPKEAKRKAVKKMCLKKGRKIAAERGRTR